MIIQMQGGTINNSNNINYGSGNGTGNGYSDLGEAGQYEFAVISQVQGPNVSLVSSLNNTYSNTGHRRFQAIRVPVCVDATINSPTILAWNGNIGGVYAVLAETVRLGSISLQGKGFRGAPFVPNIAAPISGISTGGGPYVSNFRDNSVAIRAPNDRFNGPKGEGFIGYTTLTSTTYPSSFDCGKGAPGNAGGGGIFTDSGGGGGSNAGAGGDGWQATYSNTIFATNLNADAGLGGAAVPLNPLTRLLLGEIPILDKDMFSSG